MKQPEFVIYIPGVGKEPSEQEQLHELWAPFRLEVGIELIDWSETDYDARLASIGNRILQLSEHGRVSLVGASGGGKAALSLFTRYPDHIHRVVTISSKVEPYVLGLGSQGAYPNLVESSNVLTEDLKGLNSEMLERILCVHPLSDDIVKPVDAVLLGAQELTIDAHGHIEGIRQALLAHGHDIANFIRSDNTSV